MGNFVGHLFPCLLLLMAGLWELIFLFCRYYRSQYLSKRFHSTLWYGWKWSSSGGKHAIAVESFMWFTGPVIGVLGELISYFYLEILWMEISQHIAMYVLYALHGFMQIMVQINKFPLPPNIEYFTGILTYALQGLIFMWHLHGRSPLNVQVHTLLMYITVASAVSVAVESIYRHQMTVALIRVYFILLQSTWFLQIGCILYPPFTWMNRWDEQDHMQSMKVTTMFVWHWIIDFVFVIVVGYITWLMHYRHLKSVTCNDKTVLENLVVNENSNSDTNTIKVYKDYDEDEM